MSGRWYSPRLSAKHRAFYCSSLRALLQGDNLKCSSVCLRALFAAAGSLFSASGLLVRMSSLTTSKAVWWSMKLWDVSGDGRPWSVELDVRDLGGHVDFTGQARAGTLSRRVREATHAVAALPLGFRTKLGLVRGKYVPVGLLAVEASHVSASSLGAFRAAFVWAVWSSKMPLAYAPFVLNLLDGPVGVDPAFHIVLTRFRLMRRYWAYRPLEVSRIFSCVGLDCSWSSWSWPSPSVSHFC